MSTSTSNLWSITKYGDIHEGPNDFKIIRQEYISANSYSSEEKLRFHGATKFGTATHFPIVNYMKHLMDTNGTLSDVFTKSNILSDSRTLLTMRKPAFKLSVQVHEKQIFVNKQASANYNRSHDNYNSWHETVLKKMTTSQDEESRLHLAARLQRFGDIQVCYSTFVDAKTKNGDMINIAWVNEGKLNDHTREKMWCRNYVCGVPQILIVTLDLKKSTLVRTETKTNENLKIKDDHLEQKIADVLKAIKTHVDKHPQELTFTINHDLVIESSTIRVLETEFEENLELYKRNHQD